MEMHAVGMLCALGAAGFAALRAADRAGMAAVMAGFGAALGAVTPGRFPAPSSIGAAAVVLAAVALFRPNLWLAAALAAG
ncbi:MAG TPA: hypothetical protein VFO94_02430, partial [Gammaproteobacteria bacterium]|nr:hypothetical protein [Gammaproteobacteria bacterium]